MRGNNKKIKHMQKLYSTVEHACNALNWISWHEIDILTLFIDFIYRIKFIVVYKQIKPKYNKKLNQ